MKKLTFLAFLMLIPIFFIHAEASVRNVVYLKDGGTGAGQSAEEACGDFKQAVRTISPYGGTIVICGQYTYTDYILLSEESGTSNAKRTITVTSVYGGVDYRMASSAVLRVGDGEKNANMSLAGDFVFENLDILVSGKNARSIIGNGNKIVFGDGIVCKKASDASYLSIYGGSIDGSVKCNSDITIKSGTFYNVVSGCKEEFFDGNSIMNIEGGTFYGEVSAVSQGYFGGFGGDAELNISGGIFQGNVGSGSFSDGKLNLKISNGYFQGGITLSAVQNTVDISGGSFSCDVTYNGLVKENVKSFAEINILGITSSIDEFTERLHGEIKVNVSENVKTEQTEVTEKPEETEIRTTEAESFTEQPETFVTDMQTQGKKSDDMIEQETTDKMLIFICAAAFGVCLVIFACRRVFFRGEDKREF